MNKNVLLMAITLCVIQSCRKDDIMTYQGPDSISIYLNQYEADSVKYSFALKDPTVRTDTLWVKIRVQGPAKNLDRTVELVASDGTTAVQGKDFELPKYTLGSGVSVASYPVVLHRTDKLLDKDEKLVLSVKENDDFKKGAIGTEIENSVSVDKYTVYFNDYLSQPPYWSSKSFDYYVGVFSAVKFRFMISVYGISDFSVWSTGELMNAGLNLRNALQEYERENGELYDENGDRVTF